MKVKNWLVWVMVVFVWGWLVGCQVQGIPASSLLTPVALRTQPTETLTPTETDTPTVTVTVTPTETFLPDTPTVTLTATETLTPTHTPTPTISPTVTLTPRFPPTFTRTVTRTRAPTRTPLPTRTPMPTSTPTFTPTPTPPEAYFRVIRPGPFSRIISPIQMDASAVIGDNGLLNLTLIGEDSREIVRQALDFRVYAGQRISFSQQIPFEIKGAGETARLVISSNDRFGRLIGVASVDLVLLQIGDEQIYPGLVTLEPYVVTFPKPGEAVQGGILQLVGLARPVNAMPIVIELIDERGQVVGSGQVVVAPPSGGHTHTPFRVAVAYTVTGATPARLTLRQESDTRIPGTVALSSVLILLQP